MKVVINSCYGGYVWSKELIKEMGHNEAYKTPRHDPLLVAAVEKLGKDANTCASELEVIEVPDGLEYHIFDYDGCETLITGNNLTVY